MHWVFRMKQKSGQAERQVLLKRKWEGMHCRQMEESVQEVQADEQSKHCEGVEQVAAGHQVTQVVWQRREGGVQVRQRVREVQRLQGVGQGRHVRVDWKQEGGQRGTQMLARREQGERQSVQLVEDKKQLLHGGWHSSHTVLLWNTPLGHAVQHLLAQRRVLELQIRQRSGVVQESQAKGQGRHYVPVLYVAAGQEGRQAPLRRRRGNRQAVQRGVEVQLEQLVAQGVQICGVGQYGGGHCVRQEQFRRQKGGVQAEQLVRVVQRVHLGSHLLQTEKEPRRTGKKEGLQVVRQVVFWRVEGGQQVRQREGVVQERQGGEQGARMGRERKSLSPCAEEVVRVKGRKLVGLMAEKERRRQVEAREKERELPEWVRKRQLRIPVAERKEQFCGRVRRRVVALGVVRVRLRVYWEAQRKQGLDWVQVACRVLGVLVMRVRVAVCLRQAKFCSQRQRVWVMVPIWSRLVQGMVRVGVRMGYVLLRKRRVSWLDVPVRVRRRVAGWQTMKLDCVAVREDMVLGARGAIESVAQQYRVVRQQMLRVSWAGRREGRVMRLRRVMVVEVSVQLSSWLVKELRVALVRARVRAGWLSKGRVRRRVQTKGGGRGRERERRQVVGEEVRGEEEVKEDSEGRSWRGVVERETVLVSTVNALLRVEIVIVEVVMRVGIERMRLIEMVVGSKNGNRGRETVLLEQEHVVWEEEF